MPVITTKPSSAPGTALTYITIGAILTVCAGSSFLFFDGSQSSSVVNYIRFTLLALGIVLLIIGFTVGQIGRAARTAEVPRPEEIDAAHAMKNGGARPTVQAPDPMGTIQTGTAGSGT